MTLRQVQKLAELASEAARRVEASSDIERRTGEAPACRHCGLGPVIRWGRGEGGLQRWRCRACSRSFNSAFGTGLARVKKRAVFHRFIENMMQKQLLSCRDAAKAFGIARTTAWRWRMKICDAIEGCGPERLGGVVEADETFQRESRKASREWVRHRRVPATHPQPPRPRWKDHNRADLPMKRGLSRWQIPIMTIMDRSGGRRADMLRGLSYASIGPVLEKHIEPDAALCSDKAQAYKKFVAKTGMQHIPVRRDGVSV
ncbi:MAG: IS1595 family transposase [Rhodobacteraceae bacterium]|nr:MAG: IS1595 family transposase [Paracoccaceae bacterium]